MSFQNPFASFGHPEEESFGDFEYLNHPEPSFVREDFDIEQFEKRCGSNDSDKTATNVVIPSLVTLARAYMWDRLPGDFSVYDDQQSSADLEACPPEKRDWLPLQTDIGPNMGAPQRERSDSFSSCLAEAPNLEEDDPRITGIPKNTDDVVFWRKTFEEENGHIPSHEDETKFLKNQSGSIKRHCLLRLGKAFIRFGAPTHRLEGIMKAARQALGLREAHFVLLPSLMLVSFGNGVQGSTEMRLVKTPTGLDLGRLSETYSIYKDITHSCIGASEAAERLGSLLSPDDKPFWGRGARICFGFLTAFLVCPMAFSGSLIDAAVAGIFGAFVSTLSIYASASSSMFATLYEYVLLGIILAALVYIANVPSGRIGAVICISFASQALSRIDNEKWVCYSAVSTAGVVSLLPGFIILSSAQEIAAKHAMSGSIKMVHAVVYSLFLGFSLSFGSQLWLIWDRQENALQQQAIQFLNPNKLTGQFVRLAGNDTIPWPSGALTFMQSAGIPVDISNNHFMTDTCIRYPNAPLYLQPWSWKWLFLIVPSYTLISAFRNLQPLSRQKKMLKQLVAMILISSASYAANRASSRYFVRSDSVTAVGAIVVGLLGNLYSRIFKGYAYPAMVPGVLFLIPSGISSVDGESYTGENITLRILQVSVGVTVGLGLSNYVVYNASAMLPTRFGGRRSKKEAVFAF